MAEDIDWAATARHLAGEGTAAERAEFEAWLNEKSERRETYDALVPLMRLKQSRPGVDVDAAWTRLAKKLDAEPLVLHAAQRRTSSVARRPRTGWAVAAAAALLVAVSLPLWLSTRGDSASRAIVTRAGEWRTVVLDDGSRALLAPATNIRPSMHASGPRVIELTGEALFTVASDPRRPFIVRAGGATIEDLGTAFVVRARPEEMTVLVTVTQGSVSLRARTAEHGGVVLRAGESGAVTGATAQAVAPRPDQALAWTRKELVFDATPLAGVAAELERWYGVSVALAPALTQRTLSARFSGESLADVLDVIGRTLGVAVRHSENAVVIGVR